MKRNLLLLSTILIIAGLSGCGRTAGTSGDSPSPEISPIEESASGLQEKDPVLNSSAGSAASYNTILVNSSEKVSIVPDIAEVVYSVYTKSGNASECQQKNAESVSQVVELLKSLGIAETSIQTSDYYMYPVYDYSGNTRRLTGYEATTSLTVSDLPIDDLDNILSQSVSSGINTIQSITYQASQYDQSYREALTKAVASAQEKAQVLAGAAGASIGNVVSIQEVSGYSQARYTDYARTNQYSSGSLRKEALEDSADIMPGEIQVEASIVVEYQLIP